RPVERVAPQPVAPPPPEARPDDVRQPEVVPEQGANEPREPSEATAPQEATDRIVTEAEAGKALAPGASPRPRARPSRPAPLAVSEPAETRAAVNDALAEALGRSDPVAAPSGPPLTAGEKDALRVAVSNCWNVGSLSSEALRTTVVVTVSMAQDGKPEVGTIRMLSSSGGSGDAAKQAFEAARRAIIRCGASGFDLPAEKYDQWRDIEMTFNPERMRIK
ncbi:MAG: energy transducer TonB, partial [Rhodobacteraceae bacterium]|nr:energy transducer TonB [Paracoccaceae bacterium]